MSDAIRAGASPTRPDTLVRPLSIPGYPHLRDAQALTRLTGTCNYTWIELAGHKQPILVCHTLKYFERQLPDFIRVSRSLLINPRLITGMTQQNVKTLHLQLADGSHLPVPQRRIQTIIDKLSHLSAS